MGTDFDDFTEKAFHLSKMFLLRLEKPCFTSFYNDTGWL